MGNVICKDSYNLCWEERAEGEEPKVVSVTLDFYRKSVLFKLPDFRTKSEKEKRFVLLRTNPAYEANFCTNLYWDKAKNSVT